MNTVLTTRDEEILVALARCVRIFSATQIADYWWAESSTKLSNAMRRLGRLEKRGYVQSFHMLAQDILVESPVCVWKPGDGQPSFGEISYRLQSRWKFPPKRTQVYSATRRTANIFGGAEGKATRKDQASHDLGLSAVYLHFRSNRLQEAEDWLGEDLISHERRGQKLPDAIIRKSGIDALVVDFGGTYDARRVEAFHRDNEERGLAYELW